MASSEVSDLPVFEPNNILRADQLSVLVDAIKQLRGLFLELEERIARLEKQETGVPIVLDFLPLTVIRFAKPINYPFRVYRRRGNELDDVTGECEVSVNGTKLNGALDPATYARGNIVVHVAYRAQEFSFPVQVEQYTPTDWEVVHVQPGPNDNWIQTTGPMVEQCVSNRSKDHRSLLLQVTQATHGVIKQPQFFPMQGQRCELLLLMQSPTGAGNFLVTVRFENKTLFREQLSLEPADGSSGRLVAQFCEVPVSWCGTADSIEVSGARVLAIGRRNR